MKPWNFFILLFCLLVLSACHASDAGREVVEIATTTITPTPPLAVQPSLTSATLTLLPDTIETSAPTITPPVPPTNLPDTWQRFSNPSLNVTFLYPENWERESAMRASGPDGFFELSIRDYPASKFDRLTNLCVLDANNSTLTSKYGSFPFVSDWQGSDPERQTWIGYGCIVSPSKSAEGLQAVLYARDGRPEARNQMLIFRADAAHFDGILSSLRFIKASTETPLSGYYNSPGCSETPKAADVATQRVNGLLISEYAIANESCDPWRHFDGFQARLLGIPSNLGSFWRSGLAAKMEKVNQALLPFGYQLEDVSRSASYPGFDLFKGENQVATNLVYFSDVSIKATGDDFVFWVRAEEKNQGSQFPIEVRRDTVRILSVWDEGFNSVWAGEELITFEYSKDQLFPVGAPALVEIGVNGNKSRVFSIPQMGSAGSPVKGLWSWQNHWIMEVESVLFQDGEIQNHKLGYEEIFDWQLVKDKPFFLMRQDQSFGMVYDGQTLPFSYDDIIHGNMCCDAFRYRVEHSPVGSLFYARKEGVWFLVYVQADEN